MFARDLEKETLGDRSTTFATMVWYEFSDMLSPVEANKLSISDWACEDRCTCEYSIRG